MRGNYFLDLFAGEAGVSRALDREGYKCFSYDVIYGPDGDLTKPHVQKRVKFAILSGNVIGVMLAPPCSSFSTAMNRVVVLRTDAHPWCARAPCPPAGEGKNGEPSHEIRPAGGSVVPTCESRLPDGESPQQLDVPAACSEAARRGGQRLGLRPGPMHVRAKVAENYR